MRPTSRSRGNGSICTGPLTWTATRSTFTCRRRGNTKAAKRFPGQSPQRFEGLGKPLEINTDKAPSYSPAIAELKKKRKLPKDAVHRHVKYLNNVLEAGHGELEQLIKPVCALKTFENRQRYDQRLRGHARPPQRPGRPLPIRWRHHGKSASDSKAVPSLHRLKPPKALAAVGPSNFSQQSH